MKTWLLIGIAALLMSFSGCERESAMSAIAATKMAGSPDAMQFEQAYFANLKAITRYELTSKNHLHLYYDGTQTGILVYEKTKLNDKVSPPNWLDSNFLGIVISTNSMRSRGACFGTQHTKPDWYVATC